MAVLSYNDNEERFINLFLLTKKIKRNGWLLMGSILLALFGLLCISSYGDSVSALFTFICVGAAIYFFLDIRKLIATMPNADEMATAWKSICDQVKTRALRKLGVDDDMLVANTQLLINPKLALHDGETLLFLKDKNGSLYYSFLDILLLGVANKHLSFYSAKLNLLTGEIMGEKTDEWYLTDISAIRTVAVNLGDLVDRIGSIDASSLPLLISRPNVKNAFSVVVYKEPQNGWPKMNFMNFNDCMFMGKNTVEIVPVKKSTDIDMLELKNANGDELNTVLISEDLAEQLGAKNVTNPNKVVTEIRTVVRNKKD